MNIIYLKFKSVCMCACVCVHVCVHECVHVPIYSCVNIGHKSKRTP